MIHNSLQYNEQKISRILRTFIPHVENSWEINPSDMVFIIFNIAQSIYLNKRPVGLIVPPFIISFLATQTITKSEIR